MVPKLGICTISMGCHASHTLERKIEAAKDAGIKGLELNMIDLGNYAERHSKTLTESARDVANLCRLADIEVFAIGPFEHFGHPTTPLSERLDGRAKEWMAVCLEFGRTVIQTPSTFTKGADGDEAIIIGDFQALAGLALAWGLHVAYWEESLRVVNLVNRPNFGLCIDTYHVLARVWADPRTPSGIRPGGASALRDTIDRFRKTCPKEKIIYVQLSDGEKMAPPILPGHPAYKEDDDATFSWCLYGRVFPLEAEEGAYFPLKEILQAWLLETEFRGWASMETFHRDMYKESFGPAVWAERGVKSWSRIHKLLQDQTIPSNHGFCGEA
ncbi:unnamed protein product [Clonostachys chloroleuca]|uniref:Xylose isomerase-like TIM barrel domain-containing protein n=1 Tax=Clonostachys chloroleuca TaxID=1926264 RepID=A0AA35M9E3_9HYPO|nr:unnamed protein product [Clonostachys chloroleuca]